MNRRWRLAWACCLGLALLPNAVRGVVLGGGDGQGNTNAPTDDPGWANVGSADGYASAVYLGDGWALTANHVGMRNLILQGTTYTYVAGSSVQLTNSGGSGADLLIYQLSNAPSLPVLNISSNTLSVGSAVTMIGRSDTRNASSNRWYIDTNSIPYVWSNATFIGADAFADGFFVTNGNRQMRWGTNAVAGSGLVGNTPSLYTTFNSGTGVAQGASGDSGGGVFFKDGSNWELAGIMLEISVYSGQPSSTAVYGNGTYFADLSQYQSQIMGYMAIPEPGAGMLLVLAIAAVGLGRGGLRRR